MEGGGGLCQQISTLINASTERINAFISKQFDAASKLESGASKEDVARQLEGICDRNRLLVDQLTPFYQALNDCEGVERADAYISYRIDTLEPLLPHLCSDHLPLINVLFVEEQGALEALRLGSHPLKTLLEWMGNQVYAVLRTNPDKEIFKRALMAYEGTSLAYKTLLELLSGQ